ncbi:MAG: hypothetical protein KAS32_02710 [Candidatus Peribacteraceae bacterium]|nr:hypothetical protein [Candidatus Peribacteraceae bacterium]
MIAEYRNLILHSQHIELLQLYPDIYVKGLSINISRQNAEIICGLLHEGYHKSGPNKLTDLNKLLHISLLTIDDELIEKLVIMQTEKTLLIHSRFTYALISDIYYFDQIIECLFLELINSDYIDSLLYTFN